jgi:HEAT repeat protein
VRAALAGATAYTALVDALLAGLDHPDSRVRYNCAHALDHLADERCLAPLRRLANDPVPRVRRMALHVLSCEPCKPAPLSLPAGDDLVALLVERALADPSINVRRHATAGLGGYCHDRRAIAALQTLLARETDPALLRNARWALPRQGTPRAQDAVAYAPDEPRPPRHGRSLPGSPGLSTS